MQLLSLREFHQELGGTLADGNGVEWVASYGDVAAEQVALTASAGAVDLSFRGRVCLLGADRLEFLNGQVTNNLKTLSPDCGCYAALVNAKGKLQGDLHIYNLADELLLDFEPALTAAVTQRLEKYIIAEDVQVVDVVPHYGLWSIQGPRAGAAVARLELGVDLPSQRDRYVKMSSADLGDIYIVNNPRLGVAGFDLYVPTAAMGLVGDKLIMAAKQEGGRVCGFDAWETVRVEAGIPRFGVDMDETNLAPEAGIAGRAISYNKGCYIGQEVIARVRTYGQVAKALRRLALPPEVAVLPKKGDKLFKDGREAGYFTSTVRPVPSGEVIGMGYVRREHNQAGSVLSWNDGSREWAVAVSELPA
ncbi:MAG TPA: glycine cleavage T C-terminal barrel domain-containing protein [Roseimicrobium sp.]|nr:glycine cleavage T C-terminal barrel domain-containing protein [Roseimicrobium sp.]